MPYIVPPAEEELIEFTYFRPDRNACPKCGERRIDYCIHQYFCGYARQMTAEGFIETPCRNNNAH